MRMKSYFSLSLEINLTYIWSQIFSPYALILQIINTLINNKLKIKP